MPAPMRLKSNPSPTQFSPTPEAITDRYTNVPDEVFLSHASADRPFAMRLAATLRRHGVPVWYSDTNIRGGQQWHDEIGAALERGDWFVVALSPHAVESMWVKRELLFALQQSRFAPRALASNQILGDALATERERFCTSKEAGVASDAFVGASDAGSGSMR